MKNSKIALLLLALLSLPLMACDDEEEASDYDEYYAWASPSGNFDEYATYWFKDIPEEELANLDGYVVNNHSTIKMLVEDEFAALGLTEAVDEASADVIVSSVAAVNSYEAWYAECEGGWYWYGWWVGYDSCAWVDYEEVDYEIGTILIPVFDPVLMEPVFVGGLQGIVDDSEDSVERIGQGVHWIFSENWPQ